MNGNLRKHVEDLHRNAGRFNLYICMCHDDGCPDVGRLTTEITAIADIVAEIENEIRGMCQS